MTGLQRGIAVAVVAALISGFGAGVARGAPGDVVNIPDSAFAECITEQLGVPAGTPVTEGQLAGFSGLDCGKRLDPVRNLIGAQYLTNITYLSLEDSLVSDLAPIAGLTKLTTVDLAWSPVTNLSPLAGLTGLTRLELAGTGVTGITPLSDLTALEFLNLSENRVANIGPLAGLTKLKNLNLSSNQVTGVASLSGLTALQYLSLTSNDITDVSGLAPLTDLVDLQLGLNQISDVRPLAGLSKLGTLNLGSNRIADFSSLRDTLPVAMGNQQLTLPSTPVDTPFAVVLRSVDGRQPTLTLPAGVTFVNGALRYSQPGTYRIPFQLVGTSFSGTITQQATPKPVSVVVTAATAGTKPVGQTTNVWGSATNAAGAPVAVQLLVNGAWQRMATGTIAATGSYVLPLTGADTVGTYRYRVAVTTAAGTAYSPEFTLTRTAAPVSVTAATAGTKPVGQATNVWGTATNAAGARVAVQVLVNGAWSTSQIGTVAANGSYVLPLTYGASTVGTYRYRVVVSAAAGTGISPVVTLTRTAAPVSVSAYSAGTKPIGQVTNVWGTATNAAGARVAVQALVNGAWSTSQIGTVAANGSYVLPLTYGATTRGTYTFRVVVTAGSSTGISPAFTLRRT